MSWGNYEADVPGLGEGAAMISGLSAETDKVADDFISDMATYRRWAGYSDDFYHQVNPKYQANNDMCVSMLRNMSRAYAALESATLGNLRNIEGAQSYAQDAIDLQQSKLDSSPDEYGGGRH
ncbi:hypothetical protein M2271_002304 [Streptomyces sp. LBL]|uniref:hypothetical protein n=1 Tax=Streptomyces sp. LBL TaxID=2940562 RepID=UPI0024753968|nr:hypothetical protein [Streptomyces sp. LBL]MDH6624502.1 hypothetical protein [Streptomyces sp. LBL]